MSMTPSRQVRWQRKQRAKGCCTICGAELWRPGAWHCIKHVIAAREWRRRKIGAKRRYYAASYLKAA